MTETTQQLSGRQIKALQIAATSKLTRKGKTWIVPSQAGQGEYKVHPDPAPRCTCPDFEFRNAKCKHVLAVEYTLMRETTSDGATVVTETVKSHVRPIRRTGKPTTTLRLTRNQNCKPCSTNCAKASQRRSGAEARADHRSHCRTSSFRV